MIKNITEFIDTINNDLSKWPPKTRPWFRGESGKGQSLCPKITKYEANQENHLLQSFRRQAGGLSNVPFREHIDMWLFLAQHYGVPTRLLDWTEGALMALYFAINRAEYEYDPRVYMLNPRRLNEFAGIKTNELNYPLSFGNTVSELYIQLAWQNRDVGLDKIIQDSEERLKQNQQNRDTDKIKIYLDTLKKLNLKIPIAFPAIYQDYRMISQRSCFTIHGEALKPIEEILKENKIELLGCLFTYNIDVRERSTILRHLNILGISAATIFPDLDHLAEDLRFEIDGL